MMKFNELWKTKKEFKKTKRNIEEVIYNEIDLNQYIIIDVRSRREFKERHINGSINIPLPEVQYDIEKYVSNKQRKILVCCEYGARSMRAAKILNDKGYKNVYNLKGGLENI